MGNASSSGSRDRHKSGDSVLNSGPISPGGKDGQAFTFEKQSPAHRILQLQPSHDEDSEPYYTKAGPRDPQDVDTPEEFRRGRARASTLSEGTKYGTLNQPVKSKILPTVFKWDGGGESVFISGTFSDWKTIPMVRSQGDLTGTYVAIVDLPEGDHQYKFFIDGQWKLNPSEPMAQSDIGSKNNIISVKKTDFEVFDALDVDSITSTSTKTNKYGQDVPTYKPWEKTTGPPILPPHLLQVILNKDTPLSCEPTLLPEPNHVMLNHLYALSIKDGVMVLSATHRYRKKYVTTLLYKPI